MSFEEWRPQMSREVGMPVNPGTCVHHLFEAMAGAHPDAVAVSASDGEVTYGQLNARSTRLGARLTEVGVGPRSSSPCTSSAPPSWWWACSAS